MLVPLFDKDSRHIAWMEPNKYIFDTGMRWIAFIAKGHIWSADKNRWLGAINGTDCMDRGGRVVMWGIEQKPRGCMRQGAPTPGLHAMRPPTPTRPLTPMRPPMVMRPMYGWSAYSLEAWLRQ